ncbi:hypothetical protein PS645_03590 [Pseudomonas fluorescens]|uniref:Uncharacterized protein n=1 Tax=Pseudomonas fluorescens TaxID=294 RepID=A0A5E6UVG0_PSEFL|nr:hypothetical protein PS645_03590 [Pseudomonas fluorescens]
MDAGLAAAGHGWPMAAGPRSRTGARVWRALASHRTSGALALGYLALFQVTRRKGGTDSSLTAATDMYTLKTYVAQDKAIASKLSSSGWSWCMRKEMVARPIAIASGLDSTRAKHTTQPLFSPCHIHHACSVNQTHRCAHSANPELSLRPGGHLLWTRPRHIVFGLLSGDRDGKYQSIAR